MRYEYLVIYVDLRRAKACCRWSLSNGVIACSAGRASCTTFWIWAPWYSDDLDIAAHRILMPSSVVLIFSRAGFPERSIPK